MVLVLPLSFASNVSERTRSAAIAKPKRKKPSPLALVNDSSVSKLSKRRLRPRTSLNSSTATTMALANKKIIVPQLKSDLGSYWTIADTSASIITGTPCRTTTSTTIVNTITAVQNIIIGARRPAVVATTVESTPSFITPHRLFFAPSPPSLQARRQVVVVEEETITPQRLLYRDGNDGTCLYDRKSYPQSFYREMKNDRVGNTILYLDIPLPKKMKMQCDPSIRSHLKRVSPKISDILISNGIVRHPTSKFSMDLKPMNENTYPVLYSINKPHQIPRWCNKNNTDVDGSTIGDNDDDSDVPDRDEKPEKIGMSIAGFATRRKLDNNQADQNRFDRAFIVMNTGLIRGKVDQEIVGILEEFVAAVLADKNVPKQLRLLFETYRRGGNDLGLRKQWYYQLIEISLQYYFDVASPAEAFACDCEELESRLSFVQQVDAMLQVYFSEYQGKKVTVIESWKTGAKAARLSSQRTLAEYFACGAPLRDAAPFPVYPNATTPEEIFSDDYSEAHMNQFRNEVTNDIVANQRTKGVLFLCYWPKLFSYSELNKFLLSLGYKLTYNVFQDDLIFYVDSNQESMVAVYHSPGIGLDSRDTTTITQSIRRLQLIEIIRRFVLFLQGKNLVDDQKKKGRSLIDTGFIFDSVWNNSHQNKFVAVAFGRDTYTPSSINATTQNGLWKTSHELVAPNVRQQYHKNRRHFDETISTRKKEIKMANLLSFTNRKNINATLDTILNGITNDNPNQEVLDYRWDKLEQVINPNSVLLQLVQKYFEEYFEWTPEQELQLQHGLQIYPSSLGPDQRWSSIANEVTGKSQQDCVARFESMLLSTLYTTATDGADNGATAIKADFSSSSISTTNGTGVESKLKTGVVENKEEKKKRIRKPRNKIIPKVKNYVEVSDADVLQGRGGRSNRHPGNERYRNKVERTQKIYKQTEDKEEKTKISQNLVLYVQSYGGNFLEKDENGWFIIDDTVARRKVSQALREDKDPEKRKAKRQRFLARRAEIEAGNNVDDGG